MYRFIWVLGLIVLTGCCRYSYKTFTVPAGKFQSSPRVFRVGKGVPHGTWDIVLVSGWKYALPSNQSQWLKLCGDSFCPFSNTQMSVMLGVRYFKDTLEISPYFNNGGAQWYWEKRPTGDPWPKIPVSVGQTITFRYAATGRVVWTQIIYRGTAYEYTYPLDSGHFWREIGFYGGGSVLPVTDLTIRKQRRCD